MSLITNDERQRPLSQPLRSLYDAHENGFPTGISLDLLLFNSLPANLAYLMLHTSAASLGDCTSPYICRFH